MILILNYELRRGEIFFCVVLAEKSGHGDEEGWCEGSDHDDTGFGGFVHFPFYFGILHLITKLGRVYVLVIPGKRPQFHGDARHLG